MLFRRLLIVWLVIDASDGQYYIDRYLRPFWLSDVGAGDMIGLVPGNVPTMLEIPTESTTWNLKSYNNPMKTFALFFPFCESQSAFDIDSQITISSPINNKAVTVFVDNEAIKMKFDYPSGVVIDCNDRRRVSLSKMFDSSFCTNCSTMIPVNESIYSYDLTFSSKMSSTVYIILDGLASIKRRKVPQLQLPSSMRKVKHTPTSPFSHYQQKRFLFDSMFSTLKIDILNIMDQGQLYLAQQKWDFRPGYTFTFKADHDFSVNLYLYKNCKLSIAYQRSNLIFGDAITFFNPNVAPIIYFVNKKFILIEQHVGANFLPLEVDQQNCDDSLPMESNMDFIVPLRFEDLKCKDCEALKLFMHVVPSGFLVEKIPVTTAKPRITTTTGPEVPQKNYFLAFGLLMSNLIPVTLVLMIWVISCPVYIYVRGSVDEKYSYKLEEIRYS